MAFRNLTKLTGTCSVLLCILQLGVAVEYLNQYELNITNVNQIGTITTDFFASSAWLTTALKQHQKQRNPINHKDITSIYFSNNDILAIESDAFETFTNLQRLDLSSNQLRTISFDATNLVFLDASNNEIDDGDFDYFPNLGTLDLSENKFKEVVWNFTDSPIVEIDLSYNDKLKSVKIASDNLLILALQNVRLELLELDTPSLETLDLRSAQLKVPVQDDRFENICNMNANSRNLRILYYDKEEVGTYYECFESDSLLDSLDSNVPVSSELKVAKNVARRHLTVDSDNCRYTTLKVKPEDIVLSVNDYFKLEISFYALLSLILVLACGNFTLICMITRKSKSNM